MLTGSSCLAGLLSAWLIGSGPAPAPQTPAPSGNPNASSFSSKFSEGPVDFRCDTMLIYTKPNRNVCRGNVVIRRSDMLVCCELFESAADDNWTLQSFTCSKDVRAQHDIESAWADKAEFLRQEGDLILTGRPVLHRGDSILEGERVIVDVRESHARILKPRGRMDGQNHFPAKPPAIPTGPLPAVCPIPALKR